MHTRVIGIDSIAYDRQHPDDGSDTWTAGNPDHGTEILLELSLSNRDRIDFVAGLPDHGQIDRSHRRHELPETVPSGYEFHRDLLNCVNGDIGTGPIFN